MAIATSALVSALSARAVAASKMESSRLIAVALLVVGVVGLVGIVVTAAHGASVVVVLNIATVALDAAAEAVVLCGDGGCQ